MAKKGRTAILKRQREVKKAERAALKLDLILEGRPASEMHVDFQERLDLQINLDAARAVGVRPTYEVLLEAIIIESMLPAATPKNRFGSPRA